MTKFSGVDDPGFVAICGELRRWIKDISATKNCREARDSSSRAGQAGLARQYGDNNQQYIQFAEGTQNIVGGNQYQAQGDMNFGMVPPK